MSETKYKIFERLRFVPWAIGWLAFVWAFNKILDSFWPIIKDFMKSLADLINLPEDDLFYQDMAQYYQMRDICPMPGRDDYVVATLVVIVIAFLLLFIRRIVTKSEIKILDSIDENKASVSRKKLKQLNCYILAVFFIGSTFGVFVLRGTDYVGRIYDRLIDINHRMTALSAVLDKHEMVELHLAFEHMSSAEDYNKIDERISEMLKAKKFKNANENTTEQDQ